MLEWRLLVSLQLLLVKHVYFDYLLQLGRFSPSWRLILLGNLVHLTLFEYKLSLLGRLWQTGLLSILCQRYKVIKTLGRRRCRPNLPLNSLGNRDVFWMLSNEGILIQSTFWCLHYQTSLVRLRGLKYMAIFLDVLATIHTTKGLFV